MAVEVRSGHIVALRLFDIAYAIDLRRVEELWARHAGSASSRSRLSATPAKAVAFGVPPVSLSLDPMPLQLGTLAVTAAVTARVYDFGVVALALRVLAGDLGGGYFPGVAPALQFDAGAALVYGALGIAAALVGGWLPARDAQRLERQASTPSFFRRDAT